VTRFVDSNVFVYHLAADPRHGDRATKILASIEEGERGATSTLVVTQVCSYLKWKKREPVIPVYLFLLKKLTSLEKIETSILDFEQARGMQEGSGLDWRAWDDILIAAQMKRTRISEIYSNDADFDKISGIKRIF
jgi:predicted nucleic acid-binding protein